MATALVSETATTKLNKAAIYIVLQSSNTMLYIYYSYCCSSTTCDVHSNGGQWWIVGRLKGMKFAGVDLCDTVSPKELAVEEKSNFRYDGSIPTGQDQSSNKVVDGICAELSHGDLRARDNDCFSQALQHEGQGRGCVGHGVCSMEDHKAIKSLVVSVDIPGNFGPVRHLHVAGVQQRIELKNAIDNAITILCGAA